jgi:hypothetical protein
MSLKMTTLRKKKTGNHRPKHANLEFPQIKAEYLEEPSLVFGGGREHVDPKTGLACFGPRTLDDPQRHPASIQIGFVGSGKSIESAKLWLEKCAQGVEGDEENRRFIGTSENYGFFSEIQMADRWIETLTRHEVAAVLKQRLRKERFSVAAELISDKLRLFSERDKPPNYVILALPDELLDHCRTADYRDAELGEVHRDFRRVMKVEAMKYRLPTQLLLQKVTEATDTSKNVDHRSRCAWNLFTGMYFKAGGIPWSPTGLCPATCYVGISFFRPIGSNRAHEVRASVAQAFNEYGEGLVLRGQDFHWDDDKFGKSPHLNADQITDLMTMVLKRYMNELKHTPKRVVVFKSSRYWPAEKEGLESALEEIREFDLVAVAPTNQMRLLREGKYPTLRGTRFSVGKTHYLYTTGFIPVLAAYPHGHVPSPLEVTDHIGDTSIETILKEILVLTKMNWNSAGFGGLQPVTLRFSRLVGDIMREIPPDREPLPQFKYYI